MKELTGAQALLESLYNEDVKVIFGIPGGVLLAIYDAIFKQNKIKHILMRHEQCAAHAADGYARATGKVGVCMATSGPGATNLVTGIANAHMDSIPIVCITGQVVTTSLGKDAFQEADIFGITIPIVKHSYLIRKPEDLPQAIKEAFYIAKTGRPGPVLIDIPRDISTAKIKFSYPEKINLEGYNPTYKGHPKQIKDAAKAIKDSIHPVIYAGGGIITSGAEKELLEFAEKCDIPVLTTLLGIGGFPSSHQLCLGMVGMHGTAYANLAINYADLIIAIGTRFDDRVTGKLSAFAPKAKFIHIDIDPAEISKNVKATVPIVGDAKNVLKDLLKYIQEEKRPEWHKQILKWKKDYPLTYDKTKLIGQYVIETISNITKGKAIVCTGVGQHQMWSAQYYATDKPRHFISSGGLGTMGFGLPAAIGAQIGNPEATVFVIDGDGSFQMVSQELATASLYKLPLKICILNNQYLGMVRQWQQLFFNKDYSNTCLRRDITCAPDCCTPSDLCPPYIPDFVKLAESYSAVGIRIKKQQEVENAIKKSLQIKDKPCVLEFVIQPEENVFPMIPAGGTVDDILFSEEENLKGRK